MPSPPSRRCGDAGHRHPTASRMRKRSSIPSRSCEARLTALWMDSRSQRASTRPSARSSGHSISSGAQHAVTQGEDEPGRRGKRNDGGSPDQGGGKCAAALFQFHARHPSALCEVGAAQLLRSHPLGKPTRTRAASFAFGPFTVVPLPSPLSAPFRRDVRRTSTVNL